MDIANKTIEEFGRQWTVYSDTSGFFGSTSLLADFITPFDISQFKGARVADVGAGTGRFVLALLDAEAKEVVAVEPSEAIHVIEEKTHGLEHKVTLCHTTGDKIPGNNDFDFIISIGVLHHIPDPRPVIQAAYRALKPGGKLIIWLYGKEGNELYLFFTRPLRWLSTRLPHYGKALLSQLLNIPLSLYIALCKTFTKPPLPLQDYMVNILGNLSFSKRALVIYDQLNPTYVKYYEKQEAIDLVTTQPFDLTIHHRRGYSWVVIGTKPKQ